MKKLLFILFKVLAYLFLYFPFVAFGIYIFILSNPKPSDNIIICNNVQKLYKDDILFDNFYISCNDKTIEIGKELYVRITEGEDYKVTYNNLGGIYSVIKIKN